MFYLTSSVGQQCDGKKKTTNDLDTFYGFGEGDEQRSWRAAVSRKESA